MCRISHLLRLPKLVLALREKLPGVDVSVRGEMLAPAQVSALIAGEIDLALLPPVHRDGIETEILRRDRLLVAIPAGHRLAAQSEMCTSETYATRCSSPMRAVDP